MNKPLLALVAVAVSGVAVATAARGQSVDVPVAECKPVVVLSMDQAVVSVAVEVAMNDLLRKGKTQVSVLQAPPAPGLFVCGY